MREIAPFGLRMPPELRARLQEETKVSGRSLNAEINHRLQKSFEAPARPRNRTGEPPPADYFAASEPERLALAVFRRLGVEKQLALISLFNK